MMRIFQSVADLAGNTPLLELCRYERKHDLQARLLAKLECCNVAGSAKDRVAKNMIETAEREGKLTAGSVIIEPTSGNTGIGLAAMAKVHGYRVILTMPDTMSVERRNLLRAYGAELVLTPGAQGMAGSIEKAEQLAREIPGSFIPSQFDNPANPEAHYLTTGPEIWTDTEGQVDCFVAGVGSGGSISGVGKYLRERKPDIRIVAVEPAASPLISGGKAGPHGLQGIGANFIPKNYDGSVVDEVLCVREEDAYAAGRDMVACEGVLVGITAGAALHAATILAKREENKGKTIVVLLPDGGDKYLSTPMYQEE
ncbi:MAG: cysteine synthase A [Eubacteriales bacterium]|nr:cysteine synthase A [Eubacteriales bacterium]